MIVGNRALGLTQVSSGHEERHKRRDALLELGSALGEQLLDLAQQPQRELVVCLEQAPQDGGRPHVTALLDLIDNGSLYRVLMRPPDRLGHETLRIAPLLIIQGRQRIKELLDLQRRCELRQHRTFTLLRERLQLARQRIDAGAVQASALRLAVMLGLNPTCHGFTVSSAPALWATSSRDVATIILPGLALAKNCAS